MLRAKRARVEEDHPFPFMQLPSELREMIRREPLGRCLVTRIALKIACHELYLEDPLDDVTIQAEKVDIWRAYNHLHAGEVMADLQTKKQWRTVEESIGFIRWALLTGSRWSDCTGEKGTWSTRLMTSTCGVVVNFTVDAYCYWTFCMDKESHMHQGTYYSWEFARWSIEEQEKIQSAQGYGMRSFSQIRDRVLSVPLSE